MNRPVIDMARLLIKKRKFAKAISMLEGEHETYENIPEYYLLLGTACLYAGDITNAWRNYEKLRKVKPTDTTLLLGQAAIFLRRGDTDRAIEYYLNVLENEPENDTATKAMEFIRTKGTYETIVRWIDTKKIERFYPQLPGTKAGRIGKIVFSILAICAIVFFILRFTGIVRFNNSQRENEIRNDLANLALTDEEKTNLQEKDLSSGVYRYLLSEKEIEQSYEKIVKYLGEYKDNLARIEINRILNSNASSSLKKKIETQILPIFKDPIFAEFDKNDNISYKDVVSDLFLHNGCWIMWSGRIMNASSDESIYKCDFLVGYDENRVTFDGIVSLTFAASVSKLIEGGKPMMILAKIEIENGNLVLRGREFVPLLTKSE